jgi:hypothetical protein
MPWPAPRRKARHTLPALPPGLARRRDRRIGPCVRPLRRAAGSFRRARAQFRRRCQPRTAHAAGGDPRRRRGAGRGSRPGPAQRERVARIERATDGNGGADRGAAAAGARSRTHRTDEPAMRDASPQTASSAIARWPPRAAPVLSFESPPAVELKAPRALFAMVLPTSCTTPWPIPGRRNRGALDPRAHRARQRQRHPRRSARPGLRAPLPRPGKRRRGIGLSLVKRICDRLGWQIELQSEPIARHHRDLRFAQALTQASR